MSQRASIDFVGPIQDKNFKAEGNCRYMGYWFKQDVYKNLSQYNCLVLLSDGEAAPLVVPEALAAGLSIVVSKSASANLDDSLPFVSILPDDISDPEIIAEIINTHIKNNNIYRPQIIEYAKMYFDTSSVATDYVKVIEEFINIKNNPKKVFKIQSGKIPIYLLSKFAMLIKSIIFYINQIIKPIDLTKI